jgi:tetratricopeptide (TPR) repeat protein
MDPTTRRSVHGIGTRSAALALVLLASWAVPASTERDARRAARAEVASALRAGHAAASSGDDAVAVRHLERAVRLAAERLPDTIDEANALDALAFHHLNHDRDRQAATLYVDVLAAYRARVGPDQPRVATTLHNLAVALWRGGRAAEAEARAREAVEIWDRLPEGRRAGRDDSLQLLANLARAAGHPDEADRLEGLRSSPPAGR